MERGISCLSFVGGAVMWLFFFVTDWPRRVGCGDGVERSWGGGYCGSVAVVGWYGVWGG